MLLHLLIVVYSAYTSVEWSCNRRFLHWRHRRRRNGSLYLRHEKHDDRGQHGTNRLYGVRRPRSTEYVLQRLWSTVCRLLLRHKVVFTSLCDKYYGVTEQ
jgi:hypothetical protein